MPEGLLLLDDGVTLVLLQDETGYVKLESTTEWLEEAPTPSTWVDQAES